jgi:hypothetical protein
MNPTEKIAGTDEAWEDGTLGATEAHIRRVPAALQQQVDAALGHIHPTTQSHHRSL